MANFYAVGNWDWKSRSPVVYIFRLNIYMWLATLFIVRRIEYTSFFFCFFWTYMFDVREWLSKYWFAARRNKGRAGEIRFETVSWGQRGLHPPAPALNHTYIYIYIYIYTCWCLAPSSNSVCDFIRWAFSIISYFRPSPRWISSRVAKATSSAAVGKRSSIQRTASIGCWHVLAAGGRR